VVATENLIDQLWGDESPDTVRSAVQVYVSQLRRAMRAAGVDDATIETEGPGYVLRIEPETIDAFRFERLSDAGGEALRARDPGRAAELYAEALALWRSEPLVDFRYEPFAQSPIGRLEELRLSTLEGRLDADIELGRHVSAVAELRVLARDHPYREGFVRLLMLALYRSQRQGDALQMYLDARNRLADELGIDPSPALAELYEACLRQDPELDAPTRSNVAARIASDRPLRSHMMRTFLGGYVERPGVSAEIESAIAASRLVTVVGPPGVGKSRVIVEYLAAMANVTYVDVATNSDALRVLAASVDPNLDQPTDAIPLGEGTLLVCDGVDRALSDARTLVNTISSLRSDIRTVLVSRAHPSIPGATVVEVPAMTSDEATRLFVVRATEANGDFDGRDVRAIERICEAADSLPLAVEIAAARVRESSLEEIIADLDVVVEAFGASLESTLATSFNLMSDAEAIVLRTLTVFEGDFDSHAAAAVVGERVLDVGRILTRLVSKALLQRDTSLGTPRFRLLRPIRAFAITRSDDAECGQAAVAHARYFLMALKDLEPMLAVGMASDLRRVRRQLPDIRAAIAWIRDHGGTVEGHRDAEALTMSAARVAFVLGDWTSISSLLDGGDVGTSMDPERLELLGVARCKLAARMPTSSAYRSGQALLERAIELRPSADALAALGGTWRPFDEDAAITFYEGALELDPSHPYALGNWLEHRVPRRRNDLGANLLERIRDAIERSEQLAAKGRNLPWAWYDAGKFQLLMGNDAAALDAYLRAAYVSPARFMIDTSRASIERLLDRPWVRGAQIANALLTLAARARFGSGQTDPMVARLGSGSTPMTGSVVIVAGTSSERSGDEDALVQLLAAAIPRGATMISGGTKQGVSAIVGRTAEQRRDVTAVGYLPSNLPASVTADDERYVSLRRTRGKRFSVDEPITYWADILASGLEATDVSLLALGGGPLSAIEYRLALVFGAAVGVVRPNREASELLADNLWQTSRNLYVSITASSRSSRKSSALSEAQHHTPTLRDSSQLITASRSKRRSPTR